MTMRSRPDGVIVLTNGIEASKDGLTLFVNYPDNVRLLRFLGRDPTFDEVARWQVLCDAFREDEIERLALHVREVPEGTPERAHVERLFFGTNGLKGSRGRAPLPSALENKLLALEWCHTSEDDDDHRCPECGFAREMPPGMHDQDGCELGRLCKQIRKKRALEPLAGLTDFEIGALVALYAYRVAHGPVVMSDQQYADLSAAWRRLAQRGLTVVDEGHGYPTTIPKHGQTVLLEGDGAPSFDLTDEGKKAIHVHLFGKERTA